MTTSLGKSCSFGLPCVPFVNCCKFMYWIISLLVLSVGCGIWLYQFLILAYLFILVLIHRDETYNMLGNTSNTWATSWVTPFLPYASNSLHIRAVWSAPLLVASQVLAKFKLSRLWLASVVEPACLSLIWSRFSREVAHLLEATHRSHLYPLVYLNHWSYHCILQYIS